VLGGSGFLGSRLVSALGAGSHEVVRAARDPGRTPLEPSESVRDVSTDLSRPGAAESLIRLLHPTGVFLVAALSRVEDCERDPGLARRLNQELPREVARACAAQELRLVFTSTDLVFDGEPPREWGFVESDPALAAQEYGRSKAAGEMAVLAADPAALVVRLPLLFGTSDDRSLGASASLLSALDRGESPRLFTDEFRTPLDVDNAAEALVELYAGTVRGRLHVAGPDRVSRFELGRAVLEAHRRTAELDRLRPVTRAELGMESRPRDVSLDSSRAREILATKLLGVRDALDRPGSA
jgi:dTDP-4-dehydrorhamnose reductase